MRNNWLAVLASAMLLASLTCLGCGSGSTSVDPGQTQTPDEIQAEMEEMEQELMADEDPSKGAKPAAEKPADEKPAEGETSEEESS